MATPTLSDSTGIVHGHRPASFLRPNARQKLSPTKLFRHQIPQMQFEVCSFQMKAMRQGDSSIGEM
jgi:hypothetical protein